MTHQLKASSGSAINNVICAFSFLFFSPPSSMIKRHEELCGLLQHRAPTMILCGAKYTMRKKKSEVMTTLVIRKKICTRHRGRFRVKLNYTQSESFLSERALAFRERNSNENI
jgi:hypothetical protein